MPCGKHQGKNVPHLTWYWMMRKLNLSEGLKTLLFEDSNLNLICSFLFLLHLIAGNQVSMDTGEKGLGYRILSQMWNAMKSTILSLQSCRWPLFSSNFQEYGSSLLRIHLAFMTTWKNIKRVIIQIRMPLICASNLVNDLVLYPFFGILKGDSLSLWDVMLSIMFQFADGV